MPHVTKGVSAGEALNLAFPWQWPVDLTKYDHPLTLTRQEREALSEVVQRPRFPLTFPPFLTHLLQPMSDVLQLSTSVRMRCHAKRVLLLEMHQRQRPLWAWTPEEWAEILGATWQSFARRYPKMPLCRQHVLLVGYLLCSFTDFHLLGGFTRESLAHMVFGRERMEATIERVNEGVRLWGLVNLHDMSLRSAVYEALLLNQNPYLEEITYEQLLLMRERTETLSLKRAIGKLSCALFQLGLLRRTLPHVPLPSEKRAQPVQHLLDGTPTVAPVWLGYCQRWYETSTLTRATRYQSYGFLLRLGRWLTVAHPEALHPGDWTREFAATVVAFINQLRFGEWIEPENAWRIPANK